MSKWSGSEFKFLKVSDNTPYQFEPTGSSSSDWAVPRKSVSDVAKISLSNPKSYWEFIKIKYD